MPTFSYLNMQQRIARELRRPDLGVEIRDAIGDAIRHYKDERFAENVASTSWTAVADQREYALPTDFSTQIHLFSTYADSVEIMYERPLQILDYWDQLGGNTAQGVSPCYYALFSTDLIVWPRFAATSSSNNITMRYVSNLVAPEDDEDEGWWMNEAERLIRCHSKHTIFGDVLYNPEQAEYQLKLAQSEYERLSEIGFSRAMPTRIVPTDI